MRVLQSISYYYPYISGVTLYCQRLAEKLYRNGCISGVICGCHDQALAKEESLNGVDVIRVPILFRLHRGMVMIGWVTKLLSIIRNYEVMIIHLPQIEGVFTALIARIFRKKVIVVYHVELQLHQGLIGVILEWCVHVTSYFVLLMAEKIVAYTKDYAEHTNLLPKFMHKVDFVYPPMILSLPTEIRSAEDMGREGTIKIGYVGRISHEKGIEYLIRAVEKLNHSQDGLNYQVLIAGPNPAGEDQYVKSFNRIVHENIGLIQYTGPLSPLNEENLNGDGLRSLASFYREIDVFVLPSITESFGMVQVEAMSFGKPVVVGDYPGMRVPVHETGMGIVVPIGDTDEIATAIQKIVRDYNRFLSNYGKVHEIFHIDKTINYYLEQIKFLSKN